MLVPYGVIFASTTYKSLVLENSRENGERMGTDSDF